ncbi:hypothetical protein [Mucilaginibacter sp.]|uniref:hypothetical protein n=1 Tax=Mucilaginibacter sp. TaxID=1882438 RepID=UPI002ED34992
MIFQIIGFALIYLQIGRITDNQAVRLVAIIYILTIAINNFLKSSGCYPYHKIRKIYFLFILMIVIALVRSSAPVSTVINVIYEVSLFVSCSFFILTSYVYLIFKRKMDTRSLLTYTLLYPLAIFAGLNMLTWILGIKVSNYLVVEDTSTAVMLSAVGINMKRVIFPLAGGGLNTYGDLLGALLLIAIVISFYKVRFINICIILLTLASIILVDNRSFLLNALMSSIGIYFLNKTIFFKYTKNLPVLLVLSPFILLIYLPIIYASLSSSLLRSDETTDTLLRVIIWTKATFEFSDFKLMHLIGYGEYGHYGSGVSKQWAYLFKAWTQPNFIGPHNTLFSIIFDYGYIGVLLYIILIRKSILDVLAIRKIQGDKILPIFVIAFWSYYLISGSTETLNGFYSPGMMYLFLSMVFVSDFLRYRSQREAVKLA